MSSPLLDKWKQEPVSPLACEGSPASDEDGSPLYGTTLALDDSFSICESKAELASKLLEGLEQLEDLDEFIKEDFDEWIKDEPFPNWLEEKMLPMFEDVREPAIAPVKIEQRVPDTQSLMQEFDSVFDAVELTHSTLTPPQSPPYKPLLTKLEPLNAPLAFYGVNENLSLFSGKQLVTDVLDYPDPALQIEFPPATPQTDYAHEMAVVEELVRSRAEDLIQYPSSPCSNSSSSSNFGDCSSDDPEWIPESVETSELNLELKSTSRKRSKPYTRGPPEEKKSRKKEQNKNAATRYRMKKKAEVEEILDEERRWSNTNDGLENKIGDMQREIKYLKGLMRDLFKAKGLIN